MQETSINPSPLIEKQMIMMYLKRQLRRAYSERVRFLKESVKDPIKIDRRLSSIKAVI